MYETFGFSISTNGQQSLSLFIPDNLVDSTQYARGGASGVVECVVTGDFQSRVDPAATDWDVPTGLLMTERPHPSGRLFSYLFENRLPDGYYQYQYVVRFTGGGTRVVGDPCTKYAGDSLDRSAFVVGGTPVRIEPLLTRLPSKDLIIYALMIDDFTCCWASCCNAPARATPGGMAFRTTGSGRMQRSRRSSGSSCRRQHTRCCLSTTRTSALSSL